MKPKKDPDAYCRELVERNRNLTVPWILMGSYAYYWEDDPIISDGTFDFLMHTLRDHWDEIEHPHKHLIDEESIKTSVTMHELKREEFPSRVIGGLAALREELGQERPKRRKKR